MKYKKLLLCLAAFLIISLYMFTTFGESTAGSSPSMFYSEPRNEEEVPPDKILCIIFNEVIEKGTSFSKITLKNYSGKIIPVDIEIEN